MRAAAPGIACALYVRLEARPERAEDVAGLLRDGLSFVLAEPDTVAWFALRFGPSLFGIFDAFPTDAARQAHLAGRLAAALLERAPDLLVRPPSIESADVLAAVVS